MLGAIGILLGLLLMGAVGYISLLNQNPVAVHLWPGLAPRSAFVWEIAVYAALVGWLSASLCWFVPWWSAKQRGRQFRRRVRELEARLPTPPVVGEASRTALENRPVGVSTGISRAVVTQPDEEPV
jgi:hypothetical protein